MDTRSQLPQDEDLLGEQCVYCGGQADTVDHAPPKCLLRHPLPSHLVTLPACRRCNEDFSRDENIVRAVLRLVGSHADLVAERQPGGALDRSLKRDPSLRRILESGWISEMEYKLTPELAASFTRVFAKTIQGLFYGLYGRIVPKRALSLISISDSRQESRHEIAEALRPNPLREIEDEPLPELSANSRISVLVLTMQPVEGGPPIRKAFRVTRETPIEWIDFQPGIFTFAFIKQEDKTAACIIEAWQSFIVAFAAPWPDKRGPMRKGKRNIFSREKRD